ncbi:MAG TPA: type II toxin-antitoxin system VapC family toxin [Candidatus Thermoplasmatota archaeon]|nr:type II toxin-antitoxin system VapC family toxin [Candidatus Thermoplasmatota archaeon]
MIVIDSDLLASFLNARREAVAALEALEAMGEELATTSINVAEVLRGASLSPSRRIAAESLLAGLVEVPFGPRAARRFAAIMATADRLGAPLPNVDAMVAAATLEAGARLATRNLRHYGRMPGLELVTL